MPSASDSAAHVYGFLLIPQFPMMALSSALEPLRAANRLSGRSLYAWRLFSHDGKAVPASCGIDFAVDGEAAEVPRVDALLVCAGLDVSFYENRAVFAWLRRLARHGVPVGALSCGTAILARAGVVEGQRVTVHWEIAEDLAENYPELTVTDAPYEIDGPTMTCGGGTATLDLMLHLIERHHGRELAGAVAEQFIHNRIRTSRDHQRSDLRERLGLDEPALLRAIAAMEANLADPLSIDALSVAAGVARRQLERLFQRYLNRSPSQYYMELRLAKARVLVNQSTLSLVEIAVTCGFNSPSHFSRRYREHFGRQPTKDRSVRVSHRGAR